jgi:hypothetical protein
MSDLKYLLYFHGCYFGLEEGIKLLIQILKKRKQIKFRFLRDMIYKVPEITKYFNEETIHVLDY